MFDLDSIRAMNTKKAVRKHRARARGLNKPGGHAKDGEKGRVDTSAPPYTAAKLNDIPLTPPERKWLTGVLEDNKKRKSSLFDDPEMDGTDFAHPAWWRGNDGGSVCTALRLEESVDGSDDGRGVIGNKIIERVRRKILAMRKQLDRLRILR